MVRSLAQNRYYWAVVVDALAHRLRRSSDFAHAELKRQCLPVRVASTSDLDTIGFAAYVGRCRGWMFRTHGVAVESPAK
jgi:hypothetical protein